MRVRMMGDISGTRSGVPWPRKGGEIDLPDAEAVDLIRIKMAEAVAVEPPVETATVDDDSEKAVKKAAPRKGGGLTKKSTGLGG